jgi:hypothetical protein
MQFNSHASSFDIVSDVKFWAGIATADTTSYPIADITRNANLWYDRVVSLILQADGRWQWDDSNSTDIPTGTINLVSGTQKYDLGTGVSTFLEILRVAVKDSSGVYRFLTPMSLSDFNGRDPMDASQTSGTPIGYFKLGDYIVLDKIPNYSSASGIKLYTQKNVSYFTTSDTTKEPGFVATFHQLLSLGAAHDYCAVNDMPKRMLTIEKKIVKLEAGLGIFYSQRSRDERVRMSPRKENYGAEEGTLSSSRTFNA